MKTRNGEFQTELERKLADKETNTNSYKIPILKSDLFEQAFYLPYVDKTLHLILLDMYAFYKSQ
jgi:superoxide dismutase